MAKIRHYFPGNNTPQGFFSYYGYILGQRDAKQIYCLKGGPGTGKSTFLKKLGKHLESESVELDYLHCSADAESLDGLLLPDYKVAFVDGTSPHVIDPITPGAVDRIINFGEFWDEKGIAAYKDDIIMHNAACARWYRIGYGYLKSARGIGENLAMIQKEGIESAEIYQLASHVIDTEFGKYDITLRPGSVKKFFATAITPAGVYNNIKGVIPGIKKIYCINVPEGYGNQSFMHVVAEGAKYRGMDIECYYCSMHPEEKIEQLVVPQLSLAFITTNCWHDIEPWELEDDEESRKDITYIDLCDYQSFYFMEKNQNLLLRLSSQYNDLIYAAVHAFTKAKEHHDTVETFYSGKMDFQAVDCLMRDIIEDIL